MMMDEELTHKTEDSVSPLYDTGAPPPMVLIPGRHLPLPSRNSTASPMDLASVPTTPVDASMASGIKERGEATGKKEEKVGRWSESEHQIFLRGLERHGKQWKTIATMIGSRTVVQVRTHAQKYFQKMERKNKDQAAGGSSSSAGSGSWC